MVVDMTRRRREEGDRQNRDRKMDMNNPQSAIQFDALRRPHPVELHIDELVLHGFAPGDRYPIGDAVEHELTRLFAEQGIPRSLTVNIERARRDGGDFTLRRNHRRKQSAHDCASGVWRADTMSMRAQAETKAASTTSPSFTPASAGLFQRKCACGGAAGMTGECEECSKKKRWSADQTQGQRAG